MRVNIQSDERFSDREPVVLVKIIIMFVLLKHVLTGLGYLKNHDTWFEHQKWRKLIQFLRLCLVSAIYRCWTSDWAVIKTLTMSNCEAIQCPWCGIQVPCFTMKQEVVAT